MKKTELITHDETATYCDICGDKIISEEDICSCECCGKDMCIDCAIPIESNVYQCGECKKSKYGFFYSAFVRQYEKDVETLDNKYNEKLKELRNNVLEKQKRFRLHKQKT